jgi:hypothetical protein
MSARAPTPKTERIEMALAIHNWERFPVMTWPWQPLTEKEESWLLKRSDPYTPMKKWLALTPGSTSAQLYWVFTQPLGLRNNSHNVAKGEADTEAE